MREGALALTYAEADARASFMARKLVANGAQVGDFVGYLGSTGIPFVVTFLACLKAGLTFLPVSPKFPPASLAKILKTAGSKILVSDHDLPEADTDWCRLPLPGTEEDWQGFEVPDIPEHVLCIANSTSGSTGTPKVVGHSRRSLAMSAIEEIRFAGHDEASIVGHAGTMWVVSLLAALASGACISCYDINSGTPQDLFDWLLRDKVSYWFVYPALFRTLAEVQGTLPDLKVQLLCGETIFRSDFELFERLTQPGATLLNLFGQQEYLWATFFAIRHGERLRFEKLPAGKVVGENDLRILDEDGQPVGAGVIGEIHHKGPRVPSGYTGNPERTARVFTAFPDGMYGFASGDLGFVDVDGNLHHVGRKDDQVKIRNFNVVPADIEQEIKPHPEIEDVAVCITYCARGLPRLACFYEGSVEVGDLRDWLSSRIPSFMMPQFFVPVEALPRTPTGKLQRSRLNLPETLAGATRLPPQSEDQKVLVDIWQQVLGHDEFGISDNFFDIGGDSLRAMELLMHIHTRFGRQLTLDNVILNGGTIQAICDLLDTRPEPTQLRVLKPGAGKTQIVVSHVYGGGVTDYLEFARAIGGGIGVSGICADYSQRSRSYPIQDKARDAFVQVPTDTDPVMMGFSFGARMAFEIAHLIGTGQRIILIDPRGPFNETLYERLRGQFQSRFLKSPGLGQERVHHGEFSYRPRRLRTRGALYITCDTSCKEDVIGWTDAIDGPVEMFNVPGKHWDVMVGSNAIEIAAKVQDWLSTPPDDTTRS